MTETANHIWVEKYRPDTLDDIRGNEVLIDRLKLYVEDDTMPNILLSGRQGIGKTASVVAFVKDKYGEEWQNHFLQLNASDERGIDTVRNKIKNFARLSTVSDQQFKIVFLDEADHLTRSAQPALRRIMEDYHDRTRFFLSCNYPNKIIDPIRSRCADFHMEPLDDEQIFDMIENISEEESVDYEFDQLEKIVQIANGDARSAIHTLQTAVEDGKVSDDTINALSAMPDYSDVREIFYHAVYGEEEAMEKMEKLLNTGIDAHSLADIFLRVIKEAEVPEDARMKMIDALGTAEWRVLNGANTNIQYNAFLATVRIARHLTLPNYDN